MRMVGRSVIFVGGLILLAVASACGWLYVYTADLPPLAMLDQYLPSSPTQIKSGTGSITHVVPTGQLGKWLPKALVAAEGEPDDRSPISVAIASLVWDTPPQGQMYPWQIARNLVHGGSNLHRQTNALRLAQQIHHRFNQQQILTIYLNRINLGEDVNGAEDGSLRYFGKHACDLSLDEAALIAGLIRAPSHDSPIIHPERAVLRRNSVLDAMARQGSISQPDAEQAKVAPLIVKRTATSEPSYDWGRCVLTMASHGSPANNLIHTRPGEELKTTPVILFEVLESGEVSNAKLSRSSGVKEIDSYALAAIKNMRYEQRPPGCGILQSQATVNVDF